MYMLRELQKKDMQIITSWRNDPELISFLGAPFRYINPDVDEKWFDNYMANRSTTIRCAIVTELEDTILGLISIASINQLNQSGVLHIMIGDKNNRGKGIGYFAVTEMINHAFLNLNLHRIELDVLASNIAAQKLYEKCGFVKEGTRRQAVFKQGKYIDMYVYAILREEFQEVKK